MLSKRRSAPLPTAILSLASIFSFFNGCPHLAAQFFDQGPVFALVEENDLVVDTDRHYTQGLRLSYLQTDNDLPKGLRNFSESIPSIRYEPRTHKLGYKLGQSLFTPADITQETLQPDDRPFAGWLYTGVMLQRRGLTHGNHPLLEEFGLELGVIGPWSLGQHTQQWIHEIGRGRDPKGWNNQLRNEPGLALKYGRSWLFSHTYTEPRYFDFIPRLGITLGNVETSLRSGFTLRAGYDLPHNFGYHTIDSVLTNEGGLSASREKGLHGFAVYTGLEAKAIAHTAFLDGNLFHDSHSVSKEPFVIEWASGFAFYLRRVELGFQFVYRSREFVGQEKENCFGSLFAKYRF